MMLKAIIIRKLDYYGTIVPDVEILFDPSVKEITEENFDSYNDDYYFSEEQLLSLADYRRRVSEFESW